MKNASVNVVVDIRKQLSPQTGDELVKEIQQRCGVTSAYLGDRSARLVLVDFDATVIGRATFLKRFAALATARA